MIHFYTSDMCKFSDKLGEKGREGKYRNLFAFRTEKQAPWEGICPKNINDLAQ